VDASAFQALKVELVAVLGLSKDALHIHVGLAIFVVATLALRRRLGTPIPWLLVFAAAAAGEALDRSGDLQTLGHWQWRASAHDFVNTLFWPTVLFAIVRWRLASRPTAE
jgi:hypothetical protein